MQSIDLIETYAYGRSKDLVSAKEEMKCNNIIKQTKKINFDDVTIEENKTKKKLARLNWPEIPDHPYRKLIIGSFGTGGKNRYLIQ